MRGVKYRKHTLAGKVSLQAVGRGNAKMVSKGVCTHTHIARRSPTVALRAMVGMPAADNGGRHTQAPAASASGKYPRRPPRYGQTLTGVKTWVTIAYGAK